MRLHDEICDPLVSLCAVFVDAPRSWWWLCRSGMHGVHIDPKKTRLWKIKIFIGSFAGRLNQESFHHEISWGCPQRETQHSKLNTRTNTSSHVISFFLRCQTQHGVNPIARKVQFWSYSVHRRSTRKTLRATVQGTKCTCVKIQGTLVESY